MFAFFFIRRVVLTDHGWTDSTPNSHATLHRPNVKGVGVFVCAYIRMMMPTEPLHSGKGDPTP